MEKIEFASLEAMETAKAEALKAGYQETKSITNVPVGVCSANVVLINNGTAKQKRLTPIFSLIKFDRKDDKGNVLKLMFEAVKLDVVHVSSAKSFNGIDAKVTDELKAVLEVPENYSKELIFNSEEYGKRTYLKFDSISK